MRALGCEHRYIPPKWYTWPSDVETVYRLVEDEFFDRETFHGPTDFWARVPTCWPYFNLVQPNRGKEWQSPLQILQEHAPVLVGAVLNWQPLNLAQRHHFYWPHPFTWVTMSTAFLFALARSPAFSPEAVRAKSGPRRGLFAAGRAFQQPRHIRVVGRRHVQRDETTARSMAAARSRSSSFRGSRGRCV